MGWCSVGTSGEECDKSICSEIDGEWREERGGICVVLSILEDPVARAVVRALIYPPLLRVRDEILPESPVGATIVRDFEQHYEEVVSILRQDRDLLTEVISFLTASLPFTRALSGEQCVYPVAPAGHTPSSYTAERLRPGMLDWTSRILERFRSAGGPELSEAVELYQRLLPELADLSPREVLMSFRKPVLFDLVNPSM
jgi:hypothetical protein